MSITDKLRGISPDLDRMPEQTRTKPEVVTPAFIENVQREIYNKKQQPTVVLESMVQNAYSVIGILDEQREQLAAMLEVRKQQKAEEFKAADDADHVSIREHEAAIADLREGRKRRAEAHAADMEAFAKANAEQVAAVMKMRAAQEAVVEMLAKDITPADEKAPAKTARTRKR